MNKALHFLSALIIVFVFFTSGLGLFYETEGQAYNIINQYGDTIKIYGNGIYKNDSKLGIFVILALAAIYYEKKLFKNIHSDKVV
jgi:hypothetical protein